MRQCVCIAGLLVLAGLASGCKTTFRTVDERFKAHPANYRHVQVLPIWFAGAGSVDHSLITNDVQALCLETAKNLSAAIEQELLSKGYAMAGPVPILSGEKTSFGLDAKTRQPLEAVHMDLCENLLRQYPSVAPDKPLIIRAKAKQNPFHYQMTPLLTNVTTRFGATNATTVLLVDSKVFFESQPKHTKRTVWNWTGGGLIATTEVGVNLAVVAAAALSGAGSAPGSIWIDPFWHSSNAIQHNIALVDVRTREVLWLNREDFKRKDPRDAEILTDTVTATLADLPPTYDP